ncbi:thermonuclease family protein [Terrihabitans rhizophilus]|uniref:Thermonuclease family protein n=1 Tax=Terrihabitans rhizophilus TaxID=3092662 RepID=A0ABU4RRD9_9HYPH|nr:thermonuclease family protein [Terrihabitans sp. PJ23]MDX6807417.1 thermonuclease family protein [Terrihabitans sp. PJ23]
MRTKAIATTLGLYLLLQAASAPAANLIIGRATVVDGDTIEIRGQRIHLHGIDAPEIGQRCQDAEGKPFRCGQKAANALDYRISGSTVYCEPLDTDRYGRTIGRCRALAEDLSAWMTGLGWALAYRQYSMDYAPAEELARRRKAGMWAGTFTKPWDWRRSN